MNGNDISNIASVFRNNVGILFSLKFEYDFSMLLLVFNENGLFSHKLIYKVIIECFYPYTYNNNFNHH